MISMSENEKLLHARANIDILLNEYQACYANRNHYATTNWLRASIFIVASLTSVGASLQITDNSMVYLLAFISWFLLVLWFLYLEHVDPWIMTSILRSHQIEQELRLMGYPIQLQKLIHKKPKFARSPRLNLSGRNITICIYSAIGIFWIYRIQLLHNDWFGYAINIFFILFISFTYIYSNFFAINWSRKIDDVLKDGRKKEIKIFTDFIDNFENKIKFLCDEKNQESLKIEFIEFKKGMMELLKLISDY